MRQAMTTTVSYDTVAFNSDMLMDCARDMRLAVAAAPMPLSPSSSVTLASDEKEFRRWPEPGVPCGPGASPAAAAAAASVAVAVASVVVAAVAAASPL